MARRASALELARAQLAGGKPWGEIIIGTCSHYVCRKCGGEYRIDDGMDPCAFCNLCKDEVLDAFARAIVKLKEGV